MAHIGLRLHEVEAWGGESEALPPGEDYAFEIDEVKQEPSSKKGTPMLVLSCRVVEPEGLAGRKQRHSFVVSPDAKDGSRKRLRALTDATYIQLDNQGGFDDQDLIGRRFRADVINEPSDSEDPVTGQKVTRNFSRIQNERPFDEVAGDSAGYPGEPQQAGGWGQQGGYQEQPQDQGYQEQPSQQSYQAAPPSRAPSPPQRGPAPVRNLVPPRQQQGVPNGQGVPAPRGQVSRPQPMR